MSTNKNINCGVKGYLIACGSGSNTGMMIGLTSGAATGSKYAGGRGFMAGALIGAVAGGAGGCTQGVIDHQQKCSTIQKITPERKK